MLRIDETSKTLVAPEQAALVADSALTRDELLALLSSGFAAFAAEIGQPHLKFLAASPEAGVDVLAFDESAGRVAVLVVAEGDADAVLGRALAAAARVTGWDAARLAEVHEELQAAVPGESPRLVLVGAEFAGDSLATVDWLVRRHGLEVSAHLVRMLRFGSERLMDVSRAYPAPDPSSAPSSPAPGFLAGVGGAPVPAPGHSAPPPGVPAA